MDGLFSCGRFTGFGPNRFDPWLHANAVHQVEGGRPSTLRARLRELCPRRPGVYAMIDAHGTLIYLGKAKALRPRLLSYFRARSRDPKAGRILRETRAITWEHAPSEFAALLRELELIRVWRPRFNVRGQPHRRRRAYVCLGRPPAPYVFLSRRPPAGVSAPSARCRQAGGPEKLSITVTIGFSSVTAPRRKPCTLRMAPSFSRPCARQAASATKSAPAWGPAPALVRGSSIMTTFAPPAPSLAALPSWSRASNGT